MRGDCRRGEEGEKEKQGIKEQGARSGRRWVNTYCWDGSDNISQL